MSVKTTSFDLSAVREKHVRDAAVEAPPFYNFWSKGTCGSGYAVDPETCEMRMPLRDW